MDGVEVSGEGGGVPREPSVLAGLEGAEEPALPWLGLLFPRPHRRRGSARATTKMTKAAKRGHSDASVVVEEPAVAGSTESVCMADAVLP